ncbi:MAG: response regulator [Ruminococcus sp.]|nr:response regulator [Ruminococcus sp.]
MYYSAIGLLAALVLCIVNWDILRDSQTYDKPAWNTYRKFLFSVLLYYVTDIIWGLLEYKKLSAALFADTTIYFIAMAIGISFWADYTVAYLDEKNTFGRFLVHTGRTMTGLIICMTIVNIFKPVIFTVDTECVYRALTIRHIILVCQILYLIIISVHALASMIRLSSENSKRFRILASFGIIMALCLFVQIWFPYLPLYSIAYMLGTCLLHAFVANDEKEKHKKELEEAEKITELKDRFRSLLDNLPGMTFTKEAGTLKYLACNQAFADYANKDTPEDVVGLTDAQLFDSKTAAHFVEEDKIALSLSKPYMYYEDVPDAMGNTRQLQTTKLKYKDTKGRACVLGICQDITDLINIQHEQAKTKDEYESAVKTGIMYNQMAQTLARDYTEMFYVNTDTEEFTEYRRENDGSTLSEVRRGWHFFSDCKAELSEIIYPDDRDSFLTAINRKKLMKALSCKDTFVTTFRRNISNKPLYVSMKVSRMKSDEPVIIIGFMDVDAEMREAIAKEKALSDALSSAESAKKASSTFLYGMSHDIRTPINGIIGMDSIALKNNSLDSKTREYLEKIDDNARQLLSIINDVLDMSMLESGQKILDKNEFSLNKMLEQINENMIPQFSQKGIPFECILPDMTDDFYIGDDKKLSKVLTQILSYALRLTDEHGSITMITEKKEEYGDQITLEFCITDTGISTNADSISEEFDAFSKDYSKSSDLGIAISKRILDLMNGSVTVSNGKDNITKFVVSITLSKGDMNDSEYFGEIDPLALNILVVDDNPVEAEHAILALKEVGIRAESCTSGQEALRKIEIQHVKKQPYSMILMDWNMPGMNGVETSSAILKQYGNESVIVAMTAYNWNDIQEEASRTGVEHYLEKPIFSENILENLGQIARRSHMNIFKEKKQARLQGRRILLAEDIEINAEILIDMLDTENIKVDHAKNGKEAVELFENSTSGIYSAILMDVRMPQMDGLEATMAIRNMNRDDAKRIPIIALTTSSFDEDIQLSMQAGMNAHLSKPVEADYLIRILGELIYESEQSLTLN